MDVCLRSGKPASKLFLSDGHYGASGEQVTASLHTARLYTHSSQLVTTETGYRAKSTVAFCLITWVCGTLNQAIRRQWKQGRSGSEQSRVHIALCAHSCFVRCFAPAERLLNALRFPGCYRACASSFPHPSPCETSPSYFNLLWGCSRVSSSYFRCIKNIKPVPPPIPSRKSSAPSPER